MNKRIFFGTLIIIWSIVLIQLRPTFSIFLDNCISFFSSLPDFTFTFSFSHFIVLSALSVFLYFVYEFDDKERLNIFRRYWLTLKDVDSLGIKLLLLMIMAITLFTPKVLWNGQNIPEIFIVIIFFTILEFFQFSKDVTAFFENRKLSKSSRKNKETAKPFNLFTDEPIGKYSDLNEFQQLEVKNLKNIIDVSGKEYLSIALNGSWGSGKTSILKGLKDLLEEGCNEQNINKGNCEVIELNLWQARTPENAISELENLFAELFNKVYLNVSSRDLAFFSLLAESVNSGLSSQLNKWFGENDTIPTSSKRIEQKLNQVLSHLKKKKLVILIDDLDRIPDQYLNGFLKIICYVTGLENVVTISGINREKILSQLQKAEEITVLADGVTRLELDKLKLENLNVGGNRNTNKTKKVEHRFDRLDDESFLSKIFVVQRELVNSDYHIRKYGLDNKKRIISFLQIVYFEDKNRIEEAIINFINSYKSSFNTYRELKLFFNEVFVYLIGFGGKKQNEIRPSDYIGLDTILSMSWVKVISPEAYKKIQDYIVPYIYHENRLAFGNTWKKEYNFRKFKLANFNYFNNGNELHINTKAYKQINLMFNNLKGDLGFDNPDVGIKYFRPIIEPYEFTYHEISKTFIEEEATVTSIIALIKPKWDLKPKFVFFDFINRIKLLDFHISERVKSAIVLIDFVSSSEKSNIWEPTDTKYILWTQIASVFENEFFITNTKSYRNVKEMFSTNDILELWERKNEFMGMDDIKEPILPEYYRNLFCKFFNVSDFPDDNPEETKAGYQFLLDKIKVHKFKRPENKIACLTYTYNLSQRKWEGKNRLLYSGLSFNEIGPIFLENLFHLIPLELPIPKYFFDDCSLITDSINNELDGILFESKNLIKLIDLFKNSSLSFPNFMEYLKLRDRCVLPGNQCKTANKMLLEFLNSESQYFGQGYEESLSKFFRINENSN
ncbi:MAG TPA: P-loop NTPase fold protein [Prolixibacteraceae bacterium]|nr:P-loop NTPase fold protein [Prolixibacteraceae bacterium]